LKVVAPAIAGAYGGIYIWRKRLHGDAAFKAAHRLMLTTTKLRDAIRDVRMPFIDAREFSPQYLETRDPTARDETDNLTHVYRNRSAGFGKVRAHWA
jgi:hypothetical protein